MPRRTEEPTGPQERQHSLIAIPCGHSGPGRVPADARIGQTQGKRQVAGRRQRDETGDWVVHEGSLPMPQLDVRSSGTPGLRQDRGIAVLLVAQVSGHEARYCWGGERVAACRFTDSAE